MRKLSPEERAAKRSAFAVSTETISKKSKKKEAEQAAPMAIEEAAPVAEEVAAEEVSVKEESAE